MQKLSNVNSFQQVKQLLTKIHPHVVTKLLQRSSSYFFKFIFQYYIVTISKYLYCMIAHIVVFMHFSKLKSINCEITCLFSRPFHAT